MEGGTTCRKKQTSSQSVVPTKKQSGMGFGGKKGDDDDLPF